MNEELLACPLCGGTLGVKGNTLTCPNHHCFDRARQGYVNLLPVTQKHSRHPGDTRDMVASRRAFLDQGYYAPIAEKVVDLTAPLLPKAPTVLDAGCGEGYYMTYLQQRCQGGRFVGVDISKDAVRYGAGRNKNALWLTASAAHLPLRSGAFDLVMSMFALAVPEEYRRVLRSGGLYLEVTAGREHLLGLKSLIYSTLMEKAVQTPAEYPGFYLEREETLEFGFTLDNGADIQRLLTMTPHFWRITREGAQRAARATELTDRAQVQFRLYRVASGGRM